MSPDLQVADQLIDHITSARWFAGKGRRARLRSVTLLPRLDDPDTAGVGVRFAVAEIGYPDDADAPAEHYQLALAYRPRAVPTLAHTLIGRFDDVDHDRPYAYDALQDPEAAGVILTALVEERSVADGTGQVQFHLSAADPPDPDLEPTVYPGQQSNTSVMYGEVAMIKFFRRLELGHNLDIEIHDALNRAAGADVARLYGWVGARWNAPGHDQPLEADLAMMVEKLADAHDGWELALDSIRSGIGFAVEAESLGVALAETHRALREVFPTGRLDGSVVAAAMLHRLDRAAAVATGLQPYVDDLERTFAAIAGVGLATQRVHGDFHLGQALHTPGGWRIIDFEGEPVKTLAERAEPDSVWRDIAGMLRSFDYAAASVPGPASPAWAATCRRAFLAGYVGGELSAQEHATLRAYEADKVGYEVVYEVRNRPDWVHIPLAAVAALAHQVKE